MAKKLKFLLFLCIFLAPFAAKAKLFQLEEFYLANGLRVIVAENHRAPIIRQMLWYKVGSIDEPKDQNGIAHLLEHLMFRGTQKVENFNDVAEKNGIESNAFTSKDFTVYHQLMDVSKLELAMFLEADRMRGLNLTEQNFTAERDIVYNERKQVFENNPAAEFYETFARILWQNHPYAKSVSGTAEDIIGLKPANAQAFYDQYYVPQNAVLILSGDIDTATAKILAEKYYGRIAKGAEITPKNYGKVASSLSANFEMSLPNIQNERLVESYVVDKADNIYALAILAKYLGDGETSKLHKALVLGSKQAVAADASLAMPLRTYGSFDISALPAKGTSAEQLQKALNEAIKTAIRQLNETELKRIKTKMLAGLVFLNDNPSDAANIVGKLASAGMSLAEINNYAENIQKVSLKEVQKAAEKLFKKSINLRGALKGEKNA